MPQKIWLKRGNKENLPDLDVGEPALTLDTEEFFIGGTEGNIKISTHKELSDLGESINSNINNLNDEIQDELSYKSNKKDIVFNVKDYGAKGDGVNDDGPAIRAAYSDAVKNNGGIIFFPKPENYYSIQSRDPSFLGKVVGLDITQDNITFLGQGEESVIQTDVPLDSVFYSSERTDFLNFDSITIKGNELAGNCFNTGDHSTPYLGVFRSKFFSAINEAFRVRTYMSVFEKSHFSFSDIGLHVSGRTGTVATSCTFNSCYANSNESIGFFASPLCYSVFNSCGVDNTPGIAYYMDCRGVTFNSCGAENVGQLMYFGNYRGVTINSFYSQRYGSDDPANPTEYLIEFGGGGESVTISSLNLDVRTGKNYNYKIGVSGSSYGREGFTILDWNIDKDDIYSRVNKVLTIKDIHGLLP